LFCHIIFFSLILFSSTQKHQLQAPGCKPKAKITEKANVVMAYRLSLSLTAVFCLQLIAYSFL
jgi:hypothetical protein